MTRIMYDSTTPAIIPKDAEIVGGYVDGNYVWSDNDWAMFPNARHVRIAVFPWTNDGNCLDVELGDARPDQAPGWVEMRRRAGVNPSVYMNSSTWPDVRAEFIKQGVAEPPYWVAQYDMVAVIFDGAIAKQYRNRGPQGQNYDMSVVADYWPGIDEGNDMTPDEMKYNVLAPDHTASGAFIFPNVDGSQRGIVDMLRQTTDGVITLTNAVKNIQDRLTALETSGIPATVDYERIKTAIESLVGNMSFGPKP